MSRRDQETNRRIKELEQEIARRRNELRRSSLGLARASDSIIDRYILNSPSRRTPLPKPAPSPISASERELLQTEEQYEKEQLERAIAESKKNIKPTPQPKKIPILDPFEAELEKAKQMSLQHQKKEEKLKNNKIVPAKKTTTSNNKPKPITTTPDVFPMETMKTTIIEDLTMDGDEDAEFQKAIAMSLGDDKEAQEMQQLLLEKQQLEQEAFERQLLREAQDREYQEALEIDRITEESKRTEEKRKRDEEEQQRVEEERKRHEDEEAAALAQAIEMSKTVTQEQRIQQYSSTLNPEPPKQGKVAEIVVRMPDGSRVNRRFLGSDRVDQLRIFVSLKGHEKEPTFGDFQIATSFPVKTISNFDQTFEEAGLVPSCVVNVTML